MATDSFGELTHVRLFQFKERAIFVSFPNESRLESRAQGLELPLIAQPEIKPRRQPRNPMHEEHQMDTNRELPQVERRNLRARQSLVQYLEKSRSRQRGGAVQTQRAAALANDPLGRLQTGHWPELGPRRGWRGPDRGSRDEIRAGPFPQER